MERKATNGKWTGGRVPFRLPSSAGKYSSRLIETHVAEITLSQGKIVPVFRVPVATRRRSTYRPALRKRFGHGQQWLTECVLSAGPSDCESDSKIGRSTPKGKMVEYPLPIATSGPGGIAVGPDGNIWFIEDPAGKIGKLVIVG